MNKLINIGYWLSLIAILVMLQDLVRNFRLMEWYWFVILLLILLSVLGGIVYKLLKK